MNVRSILLPTDFSECARHAVPVRGASSRGSRGRGVVCLHVVEPVVPAVGWTPLAEPLPAGRAGRAVWRSRRRATCRGFAAREECEGLEVEDVIARGDAGLRDRARGRASAAPT